MLHAESDSLESKPHLLFAARGLAYAALNTLWDVHSCIEPDNVETIGGNRGLRLDLQQHAINGYKKTIVDVSNLATELESYCSIDATAMVPLVALFCLYSAAGTYAWLFGEKGDEAHMAALVKLRGLLSTFVKSSMSLVSCLFLVHR